MSTSQIELTAQALVADGKGILAADESHSTMQKRFAALNIESTEETRRAYREMLFTTRGIEEYISGIILFDETIRQKTGDGTPFVELLSKKGIVPGIKVDRGTIPMPGFPAEKITTGLDGLRERLNEYRDLGAKFTKWRAVITIGAGIPTPACLHANAQQLAFYASLSQEADLTPVVEPEVLMDGDHNLARCEEATTATLDAVFLRLREYGVLLEGMLLKPNMVVSGRKAIRQAAVEEVVESTLRALKQVVPPAVPGIVFLSGGQSPEHATAHLNAMNARGPHPWQISFSFARALQEPAMNAWRGSPAHIQEAQRQFYHRARCNSAARYGTYSREMEKVAA